MSGCKYLNAEEVYYDFHSGSFIGTEYNTPTEISFSAHGTAAVNAVLWACYIFNI